MSRAALEVAGSAYWGDIKRLCVVSMVVMSSRISAVYALDRTIKLLNHARLYGLANGCSYGKSNLRYLVRAFDGAVWRNALARPGDLISAKCTDPLSNIAVFSSTPACKAQIIVRTIGFAAQHAWAGLCWASKSVGGHAASLSQVALSTSSMNRSARTTSKNLRHAGGILDLRH